MLPACLCGKDRRLSELPQISFCGLIIVGFDVKYFFKTSYFALWKC